MSGRISNERPPTQVPDSAFTCDFNKKVIVKTWRGVVTEAKMEPTADGFISGDFDGVVHKVPYSSALLAVMKRPAGAAPKGVAKKPAKALDEKDEEEGACENDEDDEEEDDKDAGDDEGDGPPEHTEIGEKQATCMQ